VIQIINNENASRLSIWKSQFPLPTMIKLYAKITNL